MRNHNFHAKHVRATCCRRLRCLHTSAWWPRSDSSPGFLLTSYERNTTGKLMERAVSCIQRVCASHKRFQKDDGHAKTVCVFRVVAGLLHCPTLKKPFEGIKGIEERSKHIQHEIPTCRVQGLIIISSFDTTCKTFQSSRDRTGECYLLCSVSTAVSAYAPGVPGLICIEKQLL